VDEEGGFEVFGFAGGVGYAEERVDGVAAELDLGWWTGEPGGRRTRFGGAGRRGFYVGRVGGLAQMRR
jgi:hypothetical protein